MQQQTGEPACLPCSASSPHAVLCSLTFSCLQLALIARSIKILMRMRCKAQALSLAHAGMTMHGLRLWVSRTCSWDLSRMGRREMLKSASLSVQPNLSAGMQLADWAPWT